MIHNYSYRNTDGSVTVNNVGMTKATYQHIHDSVMCEFAPSDFIDEVMAETVPEKREELYRKLIFEAYIEEVSPLRTWVYRGKEEEAKGLVWIHECNISKEAFENMEITSFFKGFLSDFFNYPLKNSLFLPEHLIFEEKTPHYMDSFSHKVPLLKS